MMMTAVMEQKGLERGMEVSSEIWLESQFMDMLPQATLTGNVHKHFKICLSDLTRYLCKSLY